MNELYDMDEETFETIRNRMINFGIYTGRCPFYSSEGECNTFNWESCSKCSNLMGDKHD